MAQLLGGAYLSDDRKHRYRLWRLTGLLSRERRCTFLMLNPSRANEIENDATLRRCVHYARDWGYGRIDIVNLFSFVTPYPADLRAAEPADLGMLGEHRLVNERHIVEACDGAFVVCAWGANGSFIGRDMAVVRLLKERKVPLHVLGFTKRHMPRHPLRQRADLTPSPWLHDVALASAFRP